MNNRFAEPPSNDETNPNGRSSPVKQNQAKGSAGSGKKKRGLLLPILLVLMGCVVFAFAAWSAINSPVLASILSGSTAAQAQPAPHPQNFAQVNIAKPLAIPQQPAAQAILPTPTALSVDTAAQQPQPEIVEVVPTAAAPIDAIVVPAATDSANAESAIVSAPTDVPTVEVAAAGSDTGTVLAEIVADTPTPEFSAPTAAADVPVVIGVDNGGEHWIDVDLSQQRVYAYAGDTLVNSFVVSTGTWQTPTVTGKYKVWVKLRSAAMSGPGYYLPDVPYIMYFYGSYGLHGTYWHNNFGTPMSHGCVNLTIPDAEWLYNFSSVGTVVNVHY